MQKTMERKRDERMWPNGAVYLVKAGALAVGIAVAILAAVAGLMMTGMLDRGGTEYGVMVACVLGVLSGGVYAGKRCVCAGLIVGLGTGVVAFLLLAVLGFVAFGGVSGGGGTWSVFAVCVCGGLLAGVLTTARCGGRKRKR